MTKKIKYLAILAIIFALFQFYKFIKIRIINLDLPKGRLVFYSSVDGDYEIYTMNINGTGLNQLTRNSATLTNKEMDTEPSFSPDGKKIIFTSGRQGRDWEIIRDFDGKSIGEGTAEKTRTYDIYMMDSDGKNQIPLTYKSYVNSPLFSPDGRKIISEANLNNQWQIRIMNADGSNEKILHVGTGGYKFSPDARKIFNTFKKDLGVMDLDGTNKVRLTQLLIPEKLKTYRGWEAKIPDFDFSPDGEILFALQEDRGEPFVDLQTTFAFYNMKIDGTDLEEVYRFETRKNVPGFLFKLCYSPDRKYIICLASFSRKEETRNVYLLNIKDKSLINLIGDKEHWRDILNFTFTSDGKKVLFIADIYPNTNVAYLSALIFNNIRSYVGYLLFRKQAPFYDNKYLCIMDIDGRNFRKIAKLPQGTEIGLNSNFVHWDE